MPSGSVMNLLSVFSSFPKTGMRLFSGLHLDTELILKDFELLQT